MAGRRQTIAVTITFRKSNKNSLERRAGGYKSRGGGGHCTLSFLRTIINYNAQFEEENNIIRVLKV
jgi:hypothetical protein